MADSLKGPWDKGFFMKELLCSMGPPGKLIAPSSQFAVLRLSPLCMVAIHRKRLVAQGGRAHTHVLRPRLRNAAFHWGWEVKETKDRASSVEKDTPNDLRTHNRPHFLQGPPSLNSTHEQIYNGSRG